MRTLNKHPCLVMAALAVAMSASFGALAQSERQAQLVPSETIYVQPAPSYPMFHGGYMTQQDEILLNDAMRAIESDGATNTAILTMVASNNELMVSGDTTDVAQSTRIEMKLKALHGGTKVFAFLDSWSGG